MKAWFDFIVSWMPFLLLIVFWAYYMRKFRISRYGQLVERNFVHMDRVEALLERIAVAVEERRPT